MAWDELLAALPHRPPFRFVDEIVDIDENRALCRYKFREDEWFYQGHFPANPITPGVVVLEAMAQAGLVLPAMFLLLRDCPEARLDNYMFLFTDADVEWSRIVRPGDQIQVESRVESWRRRNIRSVISVRDGQDRPVAGAVAGAMVVRNA